MASIRKENCFLLKDSYAKLWEQILSFIIIMSSLVYKNDFNTCNKKKKHIIYLRKIDKLKSDSNLTWQTVQFKSSINKFFLLNKELIASKQIISV